MGSKKVHNLYLYTKYKNLYKNDIDYELCTFFEL